MGFVKEFKQFAIRGNVIDMAVGVIIGAAFGKIVSSIVKDVIMPPIGFIIGGVDFSDLKISFKALKEGAEPVTINYGIFIQTVIDFLIIALVIFLLVKVMNKFKRKEEAKPTPEPTPTKEEILLTEIRDILKSK
ncbi:MAG TPA: large-conductance mechanosensitive channel protein MscL [Tenuifilaceae bacterium]|nr:large-conductance mechanosensitive channel protein MscL [Tenuifilaceae bacterium]HPE18651.1 large-conductance mechanosensitive channel protein MscL [Tenuifilaceae bacterium]HPJ45560.1 large-conductance mechanosensitive channel protein MscL [Tenuifilaceae bacterium]HPQ33666.1 large-conductance mechanosensitive channel protein MscL [Tenuifilaceae bacterium]HRX68017.1 large-conductance mechanosensitive channel protein MscL [Tenuifilaceae bacterium]